jgi:alpha-glucosidase
LSNQSSVALREFDITGRSLVMRAEVDAEPVLAIDVHDRAIFFRRLASWVGGVRINLHADPGEEVWGGAASFAISPNFITSHRRATIVDGGGDARLDHKSSGRFVVETTQLPERLVFLTDTSFPGLVGQISTELGRPPRLPDWLFKGAVIGMMDGARSFPRLDAMLRQGVVAAALVCEDWAGVRQTPDGPLPFWDWRWSASRHPDLPARIKSLAQRGIRTLGLASPYLCADGTLFAQAESLGFLLRDELSCPVLLDCGEFQAGIVDLGQKAASAWYAESVLHREMLELGMQGWIADCSHAPVGLSRAGEHRWKLLPKWRERWAQVNEDALAEQPDGVFFLRPGFPGAQRHTGLVGEGGIDLAMSLRTALAAGLAGIPACHTEIGGPGLMGGSFVSADAMQRATELAAFGAVMRTHEFCRPREERHLDQDDMVLAHFARFTRIRAALAPLLSRLADAAHRSGLPMLRPCFLHFPDDPAMFREQSQYMLGPDLLVAPVLQEFATERQVRLPEGAEWVALWSGARLHGGQSVNAAAGLGAPPLFYRADSKDEALFRKLARL